MFNPLLGSVWHTQEVAAKVSHAKNVCGNAAKVGIPVKSESTPKLMKKLEK